MKKPFGRCIMKIAPSMKQVMPNAAARDNRPSVFSSPCGSIALRVLQRSPEQESNRLDSSGLPGLLDFGPGVAQRDGAVEDGPRGGRSAVDAEVAEPLELE